MNIFFDCDYTILSADQKLRPATHEVFGRLVDDGHNLYLWSGEGERWPVVREHRLGGYLTGVFSKPLKDFNAGLELFKIPVVPDFVIDDFPMIVRHFGGFFIAEFFMSDDDDDELQSVYEVVTEVTANGASGHPRWWPRPLQPSNSSVGPGLDAAPVGDPQTPA